MWRKWTQRMNDITEKVYNLLTELLADQYKVVITSTRKAKDDDAKTV